MKNTFKLILLPFIYSFIEALVLALISYIYIGLNTFYLNITTEAQLDEYFNSSLYQLGLSEFLNNNILYIVLIVFVLFFPYLFKVYREYKIKQDKLKNGNVLLIIILGLILSGTFNIIFYELNGIFNFTTNYQITDYNILLPILISGIIGPIIEEYMFRGVIYNGLKKESTIMSSIIVTSILFAIMHSGYEIIYTLALSFILIYVYEKYKNIKAPLILHMAYNIFTILFTYLLSISHLLNYILLFIFIICLIIYYIFIIKKDYKGSH